jgi:hypothetical protein
VGVPASDEAVKVVPGGRDPVVIVQLWYGAVPPAVWKACE